MAKPHDPDNRPGADAPATAEDLAVRARRRFLQGVAQVGVAGAAAATTAGAAHAAWGGATLQDALGSFFQDQYQRMTPDEIAAALARIERKAQRQHGVAISCANTPPIPNTVFGYALNISKCKGYRDCVQACVKENNQGRDSQVQYIRVLQMDRGTMDLEKSASTITTRSCRAGGGQVLPAGAVHAVRQPAVREGLPDQGDLEGSQTASSWWTTTGASAAATA